MEGARSGPVCHRPTDGPDGAGRRPRPRACPRARLGISLTAAHHPHVRAGGFPLTIQTPRAVEQVGLEEEPHLWEYLHVVMRRRRLVIAIFLAVATGAVIRTLLTRPVYEAQTQILIERENPS